MPMLIKAVPLGLLTEAALLGCSVVLALAGGYGPCGPASWVSLIGVVIQYPGFWIAGFFYDYSSPVQLAAIFIPQCVIWSVVWFGVLAFRKRRHYLAPKEPEEGGPQPLPIPGGR